MSSSYVQHRTSAQADNGRMACRDIPGASQTCVNTVQGRCADIFLGCQSTTSVRMEWPVLYQAYADLRFPCTGGGLLTAGVLCVSAAALTQPADAVRMETDIPVRRKSRA